MMEHDNESNPSFPAKGAQLLLPYATSLVLATKHLVIATKHRAEARCTPAAGPGPPG